MGENSPYAQADLYASLIDNQTGVVWKGLQSVSMAVDNEHTGDNKYINLRPIEGSITFTTDRKTSKWFNRYMRRCDRLIRRYYQRCKRAREKEKKKWRIIHESQN